MVARTWSATAGANRDHLRRLGTTASAGVAHPPCSQLQITSETQWSTAPQPACSARTLAQPHVSGGVPGQAGRLLTLRPRSRSNRFRLRGAGQGGQRLLCLRHLTYRQLRGRQLGCSSGKKAMAAEAKVSEPGEWAGEQAPVLQPSSQGPLTSSRAREPPTGNRATDAPTSNRQQKLLQLCPELTQQLERAVVRRQVRLIGLPKPHVGPLMLLVESVVGLCSGGGKRDGVGGGDAGARQSGMSISCCLWKAFGSACKDGAKLGGTGGCDGASCWHHKSAG